MKPNLQKIRVFLVDDDEDYIDNLRLMVSDQEPDKIEFAFASSFEDASNELHHGQKFDLVVLDYKLNNKKTAFDLIEKVKSEARGSELNSLQIQPFILSSQHEFNSLAEDPEFLDRFTNLHIEKYIQKDSIRRIEELQRVLLQVYKSHAERVDAVYVQLQSKVADYFEEHNNTAAEMIQITALLDKHMQSTRNRTGRRLCARLAKITVSRLTEFQNQLLLDVDDCVFEVDGRNFHAFTKEEIRGWDLCPPGKISKPEVDSLKKLVSQYNSSTSSVAKLKVAVHDWVVQFASHRNFLWLLSGIVHEADRNGTKNVSRSVNFLNSISTELEDRDKFPVAAGLQTVCARMLNEAGRDFEASKFQNQADEMQAKHTSRISTERVH